VLDLDEVADLDALAQVRAGTQAGVGADLGAGRDLGALDMAEAANARALGHDRAGAEDDEGLDGRARADVRVPSKVDGVGGAHGHALRQEMIALGLLEQGLGLSQFGLRVDAHDRVFGGEDGAGRSAALAGQFDHVGQIVFALGVVVRDLGQQLEQQADRGRHDARVAGGDRQHFR
uniref:Chaperone protein DnaK n=1 Tax=Parastrongyloides trichosuri TaxID=131310 RepID=A0A0N4Z6A7_PARTI